MQRWPPCAASRFRRIATCRVLSRGFLHGAPRSFKRTTPQDQIAARDDPAARLLEIAREAELIYDRLTSSWSNAPFAVDHPFVRRADAVEMTAWRAFVERVRVLAGEISTKPGAAHGPSPAVRDEPAHFGANR